MGNVKEDTFEDDMLTDTVHISGSDGAAERHDWSSGEQIETAVNLRATEQKPQPPQNVHEHTGNKIVSLGRPSSLHLRQLPPQIMMDLTDTERSETDHDNFEDEITDDTEKRRVNLLQRTCLKSSYSLRKQLILAFGTTVTVAILLVMVTSIIVTVHTTKRVKLDGRNDISVVTKVISKASKRYIAELLSIKMPLKVPSLVAEVVMDRFAGYPYHEGYEDDSAVPFFDILTRGNMYPLNSTHLPLEWQIEANVNDGNFQEHVQNRWSWYGKDPKVSTRNAAFFMQGICDPSKETDCSDDNNDIETGGSVTPSPTNKHIFYKAADLKFILKTVYEQQQDIRDIGVYFANAGAGSILQFPHYQSKTLNGSYKSIGCEWMSQPNPYDNSKPIASDEEINRCRPEGVEVNNRDYNVLEQDWCRKMALDPFQTHFFGPEKSTQDDNLWYFSIGRSVYDRLTNEFIACVLINISLGSIDDIVSGVKILNNEGDEETRVTLVKWNEEGTLVASPEWDWSSATETTTIDNPNIERGVTKEKYDEFKSLVDFSAKWDPEEVRERFESASYETDGLLVSAFPVPVPPEKYEEEYFPDFIVFLSLEKKNLERSLNEMEKEANDTEKKLILIVVICGVAGLILAFICISMASNYLTKPLNWMNAITKDIVNSFGQGYNNKDKNEEYSNPPVFFCSPKTELNALEKEFQNMIKHFSGKGYAKAEGNRFIETRNRFNLFVDFEKLYNSRMNGDFKYNYFNKYTSLKRVPIKKLNNESVSSSPSTNNGTNHDQCMPSQDAATSSFTVPRRCYFGKNVAHPNARVASKSNIIEGADVHKRVHSSTLFLWIMALIVTPLLITTISIFAVVAWKLSDELPSLFTTVEEVFLNLKKDYLWSTVNLRSNFDALVFNNGLQELHILHRVASWLFLGGIERSISFTEMTSATNECKNFELGKCPHLRNKTAAPCACEWNDDRGYNQTCYNYDENPRYLQKQHFSVETQDTWPNGDRNSTTSPKSPSETEWLVNIEEAAGFHKGMSAEGYETTYDRLRVVSALSIVEMPLYNYDRDDHASIDTYFASEADGMLLGYQGCGNEVDEYAHWTSTEGNSASIYRPDICPLGKYGYDCRCRGWYVSGKKKWEERSTDDPLYVSAPYAFAATGFIGQTTTLPLVDPNTKHYFGQAIVDIDPSIAFNALTEENTLLFDGFLFVITPDGRTVIGPGSTKITNEFKPPIEELIFQPDDINCVNDCANIDGFKEVLTQMKSGKIGTAGFSRLKENGSIEEMYISYSPVAVKNFYPLNASDFSHGVGEYQSMIVSMAMVLPKNTQFQQSINSLRQSVNIAIGILCAMVVIGLVTVTSFLARVTISVTTPLLRLLEEIEKVNRSEEADSSLDSIPHGSRDVKDLIFTFKVLFKVVKLGNSAYFTGNLEVAHTVLVDALSTFKRLRNKKAIGVTSNNLGNVMSAMYRTLQATGDDMIYGMTKQQIISKGTAYFLQAIKLGEEAYDQFYEEEGWSKNCLAFMQHLSNRYFNRAIFLLLVHEDHETPDSAKEMAFRDLQIVYDMDIEANDQCVEMGIVRSKKEKFESVMGRIRGLHNIEKRVDLPDDWNLEELLDDALKLLKSVVNDPSSDLFSTLGPAGRMQQLDCQLMNYLKTSTDDLTEAARIAIRMLVEDEYILNDAYIVALGALIEYLKSESSKTFVKRRLDIARELIAMRTGSMIEQNQIVRRSSDSFAPRNMRSFQSMSFSDDKTLFASAFECSRGDTIMEIF